MHKPTLLLVTCAALLVGCTSEVPDRAVDIAVDRMPDPPIVSYASSGGVLFIPELSLAVTTDVPIATEPSWEGSTIFQVYSGRMTIDERRYGGVFIFSVKSMSHTDIASAFPQAVAFDFTPSDVCDRLSSLQERGPNEYVSVYLNKQLRCEGMDIDGNTAVLIVGVGSAFEGSDHPAAQLIVFRERDTLFFGVPVDFTQINAERKALFETFARAHPEIRTWPPTDPLAKKLYADNSALIEAAMRRPSSEVLNALQTLRDFAERVSFRETR